MIKSRVHSALFYLGVVLIWQLVYFVGVDLLGQWKSYAFPNPVGVLESMVRLAGTGTLLPAVLYSLKRALIGFCMAFLLGVPMGILVSNSVYLNKNLKPLLMGVQSLPSICWVPFAILWFGLKENAIIFVVVMGTVGSIALAIEDAIRGIPPIYIKAAKTMGADKKALMIHVILPAALPAFIAGLRQSWSFAWRALMAGEILSSCVGLGYILMMGRDLADINQVMAVMVVIIVVGILVDRFVFSSILGRMRIKRGLSQS